MRMVPGKKRRVKSGSYCSILVRSYYHEHSAGNWYHLFGTNLNSLLDQKRNDAKSNREFPQNKFALEISRAQTANLAIGSRTLAGSWG